MYFKKGDNYFFKITESPEGNKVVDGFIGMTERGPKIKFDNCTFVGNSRIFADVPFTLDKEPVDEEVLETDNDEKYKKELEFVEQQMASAPDELQAAYWTSVYNRLAEAHQNKQGRTK